MNVPVTGRYVESGRTWKQAPHPGSGAAMPYSDAARKPNRA